jgi:hypothetical protein
MCPESWRKSFFGKAKSMEEMRRFGVENQLCLAKRRAYVSRRIRTSGLTNLG